MQQSQQRQAEQGQQGQQGQSGYGFVGDVLNAQYQNYMTSQPQQQAPATSNNTDWTNDVLKWQF